MTHLIVRNIRELLQEAAKTQEVEKGTEVTVYLKTNNPPLVVPDNVGDWVLIGWKEHRDGDWQLEYRYRAIEYCLMIDQIMMQNSRTVDRESLVRKLKALNEAYGPERPFSIKVCK